VAQPFFGGVMVILSNNWTMLQCRSMRQLTEAKRGILKQVTLQGGGVSKAQRAFAVLPPQDMRIGARVLSHISFVTPVSSGKNVPTRDEDGVLPTLLFQRVFISSADHYVVFDSEVKCLYLSSRERRECRRINRSFLLRDGQSGSYSVVPEMSGFE
jgi:hypothetical protein